MSSCVCVAVAEKTAASAHAASRVLCRPPKRWPSQQVSQSQWAANGIGVPLEGKNWLAGLQCQDADASLENKQITIITLMAFGVEMFWISGDTSLNLNQTGGCSFPSFLSPT